MRELSRTASGAQSISTTTVSGNSVTGISVSNEGTTTLSFFAKDNAGNTETTKSVTIKIDKTVPGAPVITFPAASGIYTTAQWNAGCGTAGGDICGTAADNVSGSGIGSVAVSIKNALGLYWDGTTFVTNATDLFVNAAGTTSWSYALAGSALPDGNYTVTAKA